LKIIFVSLLKEKLFEFLKYYSTC